MAALAVDVRARVLGDCVVASQFDGALGYEPSENRVGELACQLPGRPTALGEDTVITARVPGGQRAKAAEQIGDGAPTQGQDGDDGEKDESAVGRAREDRFERVQDGVNLLGQLLMQPIELASTGAGLLDLLASVGAALLPGQMPVELTSYTGHGSLLTVRSGSWPISTISPRRLAFRKPQKNGKSRTEGF
jgi:hypothetical protein